MYRGKFYLNLWLYYRDIVHRVETQGLNVNLIGNTIFMHSDEPYIAHMHNNNNNNNWSFIFLES